MINREVVVTGLGAVTSIGIGKEEFWANVLKGKSGISDVTLFDTTKFKRHRAGEIKNFNSSDFIPAGLAKFIGRASQFGIAATKLAFEDANFPLEDIQSKKIAYTSCDRWRKRIYQKLFCDFIPLFLNKHFSGKIYSARFSHRRADDYG